jgi:antitoxin component of RelBE/YafQ-DinJ toxin-antitoxin module
MPKGAPKSPKPKPLKEAVVNIRLTAELKDRIATAAEKIGTDVSTFFRMAAIEKMDRG